MRATIFFAALFLAFGLASAAVSAPIAYEDFGVYVTYEDSIGGLEGRIVPNFKDGNPVGGQSPPDTATSGIYNWVAPANPWGAHRVYTGDLSYPDHFIGGGKRFREESGGLDVTATLDVQSVTGTPGGVFASLENPSGVIGQDGSTLYVSFLYQLLGTGTSVTQNFLEFREGTTNRFRFGQVWQDDQITAQGFDLTPLDTDPHLAVLKIEYAAGDDTVSLYFDPVAGLPESSQTVTNTYAGPMEMDQIYFKGQGNSFDFDELRFGTAWEDVVPVASGPPPGELTGRVAAGPSGTVVGAAFEADLSTGEALGTPVNWKLEVFQQQIVDGLTTDWHAGTGDLGLGGLDGFFAGNPTPSVAPFQSPQVAFSPQFGFPQEIVDAGLEGDGNRTVRYTGQIFIPEDGTYNFKDGVDETTRLIIDGQTIIADSDWTNFDGTGGEGGGGSPISPATFDVADGGEWLDFEFIMSETCCGNQASLYWDYDAANGGLGANADFPAAFTDPAGLGALVPPENFRTDASVLIDMLEGTGQVGDETIDEIFMDALGNSLQLPIGEPVDVRLTITDPAGVVAPFTLTATLTAGGAQVIPEPSTFALAALGLIFLGLGWWRQKRAT